MCFQVEIFPGQSGSRKDLGKILPGYFPDLGRILGRSRQDPGKILARYTVKCICFQVQILPGLTGLTGFTGLTGRRPGRQENKGIVLPLHNTTE